MKFDRQLADRAAQIARESIQAAHDFTKRNSKTLVAGAASLVGGSAFADSTAAVAAITSAQTDALAVAGGLVSMGVAIWGALYLYRKFFK